MDFDKLLAVVKASQIATITTQKVMIKRLADNSNTDYGSAITTLDAQSAAVLLL